MLHLTLNTGHARRSPRSEVADDVVARLRPLVAAGGGPIPGPTPGYTVRITHEGQDAIFTVSHEETPVLTAGVATANPWKVWEALLTMAPITVMTTARKVGMPAEPPWLAVVLHDLSRPADLHWLADFERCLAWTLMETAEPARFLQRNGKEE